MTPGGEPSGQAFLLAFPAGHSVSPAMHQAAFDRLGLDATYSALETAPEGLAAVIEGFRHSAAFLGANVTVPHKRTVILLLDALSDEARSIGAVNTIIRASGGLLGDNTDAAGFSRALEELWPRASRAPDARALLLGAGGSARAVARTLLSEGLEVGIAARRPAAAAELATELRTSGRTPDGSGRVLALSSDEARQWLQDCDALINSTPVGMVGGGAPYASPAPAPLAVMREDAVVYDLVYRPAFTPLLAEAAENGLRHANGLSMLVWQGALSLTAWTGREAPVDVMYAAANEALG